MAAAGRGDGAEGGSRSLTVSQRQQVRRLEEGSTNKLRARACVRVAPPDVKSLQTEIPAPGYVAPLKQPWASLANCHSSASPLAETPQACHHHSTELTATTLFVWLLPGIAKGRDTNLTITTSCATFTYQCYIAFN